MNFLKKMFGGGKKPQMGDNIPQSMPKDKGMESEQHNGGNKYVCVNCDHNSEKEGSCPNCAMPLQNHENKE